MRDKPAERAAAARGHLAPSAEEVVERQIEAFNRRGLEDFLACFADSAELLVEGADVISGREALREVYGRQFAGAAVRATVLARMTQGDWVVDRERADGPDGAAITVLALYRVRGGLIDRVRLVGRQAAS